MKTCSPSRSPAKRPPMDAFVFIPECSTIAAHSRDFVAIVVGIGEKDDVCNPETLNLVRCAFAWFLHDAKVPPMYSTTKIVVVSTA